MAILNRNDPYTAIPQLEALITGTMEKQQKTDRATELIKELLGEDEKTLEELYKDLADAKSTLGENADDLEELRKDVYGHETYLQAIDENGQPLSDDEGNPIYVQATDEDGNPLFDDDGNPIYEEVRVGGALSDIKNLEDETDEAFDKIDDTLTGHQATIQELVEKQEELAVVPAMVDTHDDLLRQWGIGIKTDEEGYATGEINGQKIAQGTITSEKIATGSILITNLAQETVDIINEPLKYIRSKDDPINGLIIEIGEVDSPYRVEIAKDGMRLYAGDVAPVAYFTTNTMKITKARLMESLTFGKEGDNISDFGFVPQNNGNLSFKKIQEA